MSACHWFTENKSIIEYNGHRRTSHRYDNSDDGVYVLTVARIRLSKVRKRASPCGLIEEVPI